MKRILLTVFLAIVCFLIGGGTAFFWLKSTAGGDSLLVKNGCWTAFEVMDLHNPVERSLIALVGLFALRESEVLYFSASIDSEGIPLSSDHEYVMEGAAPDARYWSYTLYGEDHFLVGNEADRFGFNLDNLLYEDVQEEVIKVGAENRWYQIHISPNALGKNWLPSGDEDQFHILLRMYNPSPSVYENLGSVGLPTIKKLQ